MEEYVRSLCDALDIPTPSSSQRMIFLTLPASCPKKHHTPFKDYPSCVTSPGTPHLLRTYGRRDPDMSSTQRTALSILFLPRKHRGAAIRVRHQYVGVLNKRGPMCWYRYLRDIERGLQSVAWIGPLGKWWEEKCSFRAQLPRWTVPPSFFSGTDWDVEQRRKMNSNISFR